MGLLSDPEYGSLRWVRLLKKFHGVLSYLCYFGGLVWFFLLACKEFNNETYFSENALLPGLATNEFNAEQSARQFHNEFLQELEDKYSHTDEMPVPWLVAKMSQLHLEVYTHNFTLNYPLGQGQTFKGTNVYGILRAPRTSSLEALVISAPYRPLSSHMKGTTAGIALMLAFAQFARPQKYWAKDIIFLITEHEQLGVQAWLEAYHGLKNEPENFYSSLGSFHKPEMPTLDFFKLAGFHWAPDQSKCLDPGTLKGRSGSIQAAINLELHTPKIKYIAVKIEGLNGQLPNLDLVNLVLKLCMKAGIHQSYKSSYSWMRNRYKGDDWSTAIWTMLEMMQTQAPGVPNGNHGLFHRFGIEAVTLEGRDAADPGGTPPRAHALSAASFYRLGGALESIVRSMNNLLERFHQSYFFYMLAATNRFISIGQYMPSLCLMCVALLIRALGFWVTIQKDLDDEPDLTPTKATPSGNEDQEKPDQSVGSIEKQWNEWVTAHQSTEDGSDDEGKREKQEKDGDGIRRRKSRKTEGDKESQAEEKDDETVLGSDDEGKPGKPEKQEKDGDGIRRRKSRKTEGDKESQADENDDETVLGDKKLQGIEKKREAKKTKEQGDKEVITNSNEKKNTELSFSMVNIGANYLVAHLLGYLAMNSPFLLSRIGATYLDLPSEKSVYYGLALISVFTALLMAWYPRLRSTASTREEITLTNILALVQLATACLAIGMHNYPLGLVLATLYTPVALVVRSAGDEGRSRLLVYLQRVLCVLSHPLLLLSVGMTAYARVLFPEEAVGAVLERGRDAAMQAVMFSIVDSMIYGNWLFNVVTLVMFPVWLVLWQIAAAPAGPVDSVGHDAEHKS